MDRFSASLYTPQSARQFFLSCSYVRFVHDDKKRAPKSAQLCGCARIVERSILINKNVSEDGMGPHSSWYRSTPHLIFKDGCVSLMSWCCGGAAHWTSVKPSSEKLGCPIKTFIVRAPTQWTSVSEHERPERLSTTCSNKRDTHTHAHTHARKKGWMNRHSYDFARRF